MRCADVASTLSRVEAGRVAWDDALAELERAGFLARPTSSPPGLVDLDALRGELAGVTHQLETARQQVATLSDGVQREARVELVSRLERRERELRSAVLEASEAHAAARPEVTLTWRGRALLQELEPRLGRLGDMDVAVFSAEMAWVRAVMAAVAAKARDVLAAASPAVPWIDEIGVRAAAIGLAGSPSTAGDIAAAWTALCGGLRESPISGESQAFLAETLALSPYPADGQLLRGLAARLLPTCADTADALACAALAWSEGPAALEDTIRGATELAASWGPGARAPAFLLVDAGRAGDAGPLVPELAARVAAATADDAGAARLAAAFLALSPAGADRAFDRFREVRAWLCRFGTTQVTGPAAMLTLLDADAPELLDDLRLASGAVQAARVSLGAFETLGLGVKLLLQVALRGDASAFLPQGPSVAPLGSASLAVALPVASLPPAIVQAVSTFHHATIHRLAVADELAHPLHGHRVFG
jgi:hypothetical protein